MQYTTVCHYDIFLSKFWSQHVRNNLEVNFVLCYHTLLDSVINVRLQLFASQCAVWTCNCRIFGIVAEKILPRTLKL
jgi:hypothetical protein